MNNTNCPSMHSNNTLIRAIFIMSTMLITTLAITLIQSMGYIENHLIIEAFGILFGLILVITANSFPKQIFPNPKSNRQRMVAWLFVVTGVLYIIVWITGNTKTTPPVFSLMFAPACFLSMLLYRYANPIYIRQIQDQSTETNS